VQRPEKIFKCKEMPIIGEKAMQSKICHYLQDILIHQLFVPGILPQTLFQENFVSEYFIPEI
jgi:hypothetical protein